jgi:hypothetical protein
MGKKYHQVRSVSYPSIFSYSPHPVNKDEWNGHESRDHLIHKSYGKSGVHGCDNQAHHCHGALKTAPYDKQAEGKNDNNPDCRIFKVLSAGGKGEDDASRQIEIHKKPPIEPGDKVG